MVVEDHLKKVITMTKGKVWNPYDNKLIPRANHSVFGDYPADYMKDFRRKSNVTPLPKIEDAERSLAAAGRCKYSIP